MNPRFEAGDFISFTYRPPAKPPKKPRPTVTYVRQPDGTTKQVITPPGPVVSEPPSDPSKNIMVLHPNWHNKVHGVDLGRLTPAEVQVLKSVMDPKVKAAVDAGQWPVEGAPNYPLIRDILRRMDPAELITNPLAFYQRLIKPFINGKDCYRQYWPNHMYNARVLEESSAKGPVVNPKPLFHK